MPLILDRFVIGSAPKQVPSGQQAQINSRNRLFNLKEQTSLTINPHSRLDLIVFDGSKSKGLNTTLKRYPTKVTKIHYAK